MDVDELPHEPADLEDLHIPWSVLEDLVLRRAYLEKMEQFCTAVKRGCRKFGIDYTLLRTDRPFDVTLSNYLSQRSQRIK